MDEGERAAGRGGDDFPEQQPQLRQHVSVIVKEARQTCLPLDCVMAVVRVRMKRTCGAQETDERATQCWQRTQTTDLSDSVKFGDGEIITLAVDDIHTCDAMRVTVSRARRGQLYQ